MQQTPKRGVRARRRRSINSPVGGGAATPSSGAGAMASALSGSLSLLPTRSRGTGRTEMATGTTSTPAEDLPKPATAPAPIDEPGGTADGEGWSSWASSNWRRLQEDFLAPFWDRIRGVSFEGWLWIGVLVLATALRFWGLGDKPLHHDESMHAYFSLVFAEDPSSYSYNPLLHGPFQFHAEALMFAFILGLQAIFVHGASGNPWINDTTARIVPALFGVGIVALPLGLRREIGRYAALTAAFLLAVSPTFVYFSRFLREDIYFNFFMFAMVVSAVNFAHSRQLRWFVALFASTVLAYATFEGIYLTLAIFGSFLAILLAWELAQPVSRLLPEVLTPRERLFFSRAGLLALLGIIGGLVSIIALRIVDRLSNYTNSYPNKSEIQVQNLENISVAVLLYGSILIALLVIGTLLWRMYYEDVQANLSRIRAEEGEYELEPDLSANSRVERVDQVLTAPSRWVRSIANRFDRRSQPFLWTLFNISWIYWFVAFVVCWVIFAALYWTIPGPGGVVSTWAEGFQQGIGHGIWQGLYYWIEQQNVDRGGQPYYYYLLLIPLYEQLAVVFGLIGVVYSLIRPTHFRLFLVWWFVLSLILYSWAGEKMPWLSIHILLSLMLLAAIAVARALEGTVEFVKQNRQRLTSLSLGRGFPRGSGESALPRWQRPAISITATAVAVLLLIPMVHSMIILSHQDAADGPHEMMIYVQTTEDVDSVMNYINHADQVLYHGQHKLRIGVGAGEEWPYYWYLRDYPNTIFEYQAGDSIYVQQHPVDVLLLYPSGDPNKNDAATFMAQHPTGYTAQTYKLRSWWDEGYKPLPPASGAQPSQYLLYGDGLGNYLVYGKIHGSGVAPGTPINWLQEGPVAAGRLWDWLWNRTALGGVDGSYDFVMIARSGMPMPLPTPLRESATP
ncbi:MAG: flippase activity-associated protein Agl23 [Ktedonobacterales bacterium]